MTTIIELNSWLDAFRHSKKSIPHGSALWAYKVTDVELFELQQILSGLAQSQSISRIVSLFEDKYAEAFVLFASTWLQRNCKGRPKWDPLLSAIEASDLDANQRMSLVKRGLRKWGLSVFNTDTSNRYLDTLTCQGGFPRSDLLQQSASHIMDYFERVLSRYERYQHSESLEDIAVESLSGLPITLQQTAFATLVTRLIDCLLEWKFRYDLGSYGDAVMVLDNENRNWRQELPFLVLDEEAQTLINKLLKRASTFKRREMNPIRIKRQLVPVGDDYRLTADLYIAKVIHPEDLSRQFGGITMPTAFLLSTRTCDGNSFRTASFTLRTGANSGWQVSSYHTTVKNSVAAGELSFSIDSDGCHVLDSIYYRGESLDPDMPWVFELSGSTINYIGQGSVKSNKDRLIVVSSSCPVASNVIANVIEDGNLINSDLKIYKISGEVEIEGLAGRYRISCNSGESEEFKVYIESAEYVDVQSKVPIYRGVPNVTFKQSDEKYVIPSDELFWLSKGDIKANLKKVSAAIGTGVLVWKRANTMLWERRCIVLPENFEYKLNHTTDLDFGLVIHNAQNPKIGMLSGFENWLKCTPSYEANEIHLELTPKDAKSESVGLSLLWSCNEKSETEIQIPICLNVATLTDRKGNQYRELELGSLTIADLANHQLFIRFDGDIAEIQLVVHLFGKPTNDGHESLLMVEHRNVQVSCIDSVSKIKGVELASVATRLFALTDQLESYMRFKVFAGGQIIADNIPPIMRYKHEPKFIEGFTAFTLRPTPTLFSIEDPVLYLSPIWDFDREPIELRPDDKGATMWQFQLPEPKDVEYGRWLIWGDASMSVRPRIKDYAVPIMEQNPAKLGSLGAKLISVMGDGTGSNDFYEESLKPGSLPYKVKYLNPSDPDSLSSLNKSVRNLGSDINHLGWNYIDGVMKRIGSLDPLALYAMTSLQRNLRTLAVLLFRYKDRFNETWELAGKLGVSWYSVPPNIWIEVIKQYYERFMAEGEPLRSISEEKYWEYVFRDFEQFEAKGVYFKYLVDLATDRLSFEPVAIWDDEFTQTNDLSNKTVGHLFLQERAALMDRHKGRLLSRVGTRKTTEKFISSLETFWPTHTLPRALDGFLKFAETSQDGSNYRTKQDAWTLTMAVPLKLGFCLSGYYSMPYQRRSEMHLLSQVIFRIDEFDREWLQRALMLAHMACDLLNIDKQNASNLEAIA
ncbi:MAG: STY4851/ECs_5259 family protein [Limnobacter sp.]|uniref:STY4851/ECs_5259 family protein n=1 Tax=Limnobacter sp. TaxID=2003368 RepID=UPI0022C4D72F|nr:STY4851/ECs_5259 family protein [Limnobacter sp.]MCZ8016222.1 STY4851/ECs_5259 family protein [Limnobacter sp.]